MDKKLRFHNKKFKVMLVGDPHCAPEDRTAKEQAIIKDYLALQYAAIEREQPDLVVLLGDNATGSDAEEITKTLLRLTGPYVNAGIPYSFILGNHDLERGVHDLKELYDIYKTLPGCILPDNCTDAGDYRVLVYDETGGTPLLNLLHLYSGNRGAPEDYSYYAHVKPAQLSWLKDACADLENEYGRVPAVLFQHIPVPEEFALLQETGVLGMLADSVTGQNEQKGHFYRRGKDTVGYVGESPCAAAVNSGEFEAIKETKSIFAVFFGHDHMNDFTGMYDGILMGQCQLASFNAYGDGLRQGVRILEFEEDKPFVMQTRMVRYRELIGMDCRSLSGSIKVLRDRTSIKIETSLKVLGSAAAVVLPVLLLKKLIGDK